MNYIKTIFSTVFILSICFTAFAQDVRLTTQAEVDAFDKSITTVNGNLIIDEYSSSKNIKNLDGLSQIMTIGGDLSVGYNSTLMNIDGLSQITNLGGKLSVYKLPDRQQRF